MSDPLVRSIKNLSFDNEVLSTHGSDTVDNIETPKVVEKVEFSQDSGGKWSQYNETEKTGIEKDIVLRQNESDRYDTEVKDFTELAQISDDKIISIATQINQKKQLIIDKIAEAAGAGCSVGLGTSGAPSQAVVGGVTLGVGVTIKKDYPYIKKYGGLDNYGGVPFSSDDVIELTASNSGQGYFSGFTENSGAIVGTYYTVYSGNPLILITDCAECTAAISQAAADIATLRSQLDTALINNTNKIKDRKTESEVFVWGYKSRDSRVSSYRSTNNETIDTLNGMDIDTSLSIIVKLDALLHSGGTTWDNKIDGYPDAIVKEDQFNSVGGYFEFAGSGEDDEIILTDVPIDTNYGITVEQVVWLNPDVATSTSMMPFTFYNVPLNTFYYAAHQEFGFNNSNSLVYGISDADDVFSGKWVHYVAYFPPNWSTTTYTDAKIWINGVKQSISIVNGTVANKTLSSTQTMAIGGGYTDGADSYTWNGRIATTNIYNQELTDSQVLGKFNAVKDRFSL